MPEIAQIYRVTDLEDPAQLNRVLDQVSQRLDEIQGFRGGDQPSLYQLLSEKAKPGGYASLDAEGKVPAGQLSNITYQEISLKADVPLTSADIYYDGPTLSLPAGTGTWLLLGAIQLWHTVAAVKLVQGKLWDGGATVEDSGQIKMETNGQGRMYFTGRAIGGGTWRISAACTGTGVIMIATPTLNNAGCENTASYLRAVKIA